MRKIHNNPSIIELAFLSACVLAGTAGCAVHRNALEPDELHAVRARYLEAARADTLAANEKILRRMHAEQSAYQRALDSGERPEPPTFDVLILSGGGDRGAFGAGFLSAWAQVDDPDFAKPEFDMVTGVSTGALIAPFAFIGDETNTDRIVELYATPKKDWLTLRGLFFFLPGNESFMDNAGLRRDLEEAIDAAMVTRIAQEHRDDRVLAINTTNLDVGAMHPFELSMEASVAERTGDASRLHSILLASAAIPAVFPPVVIDGALYVDGGTTSNILYGANWLSPKAPLAAWREQHPDLPRPRLRFWVIVNNQIETGAQVVQPTWLDITRASLATTIRAGTVTALRHLYSQTQTMEEEGWDVRFRYVSIPGDWTPPNPRQFDTEVMCDLIDLGMRMGFDPKSWREDFAR